MWRIFPAGEIEAHPGRSILNIILAPDNAYFHISLFFRVSIRDRVPTHSRRLPILKYRPSCYTILPMPSRCLEPGCGKTASCGYPGLDRIRCVEHLTDGMIRNPKTRCKVATCKEIALYGPGPIARHCEEHKIAGEQNLIEGRCANCGLECIVLPSGKCNHCGSESTVKKRVMEKQLRVKAILANADEAEGRTLYSYDRVIDAACNRKRPDFVYDAGSHFIVIECDEYQHTREGYGCEQTRMWEIAQALGLPTIFIRYNPDAFKSHTGKRGAAAQVTREKTLVSWLKYLYNGAPPESYVMALYLYYDGWRRSEDAKVVEVKHPILKSAAPGSGAANPKMATLLADEELVALLDKLEL